MVAHPQGNVAIGRDVAAGVSALDNDGNVLGQASQIILVRDGSNNLYFVDRTSSEKLLTVQRVSATDAEIYAHDISTKRVLQVDEKMQFGTIVNYAKGITPTNTGTWATAPTTLGNLTDNDPTTSTVAGSTIQETDGAAAIHIDLGTTVLIKDIYWNVGLYVTGTATSLSVLQTSPDDSEWTSRGTSQSTALTVEQSKVETITNLYIRARYIRISCRRSPGDTGTAFIKAYETLVESYTD